MNHDLYFVPMLARALQAPDQRESLAQAFTAIEKLGQKAGFEEGYRNFHRFMAEASGHRQLLDEQSLRMSLVEWIARVPGETERWSSMLSELAEATPWLKHEADMLCQVYTSGPRTITLQLLRDGQSIADLTFETAAGRCIVDAIHPGHYALKLNTGLVLWEGMLAATDLIWTHAFGAEGLALAAETGAAHRRVSREIDLAEAHLVLRLFPGLEAGTLEVELTP